MNIKRINSTQRPEGGYRPSVKASQCMIREMMGLTVYTLVSFAHVISSKTLTCRSQHKMRTTAADVAGAPCAAEPYKNG